MINPPSARSGTIPEVQSFYTQIRDLILAAIRKDMVESGSAEEREALNLMPKLAAEMIQSPIAFGMIEVPVQNSSDMPFGFVVLVDAAKRKDKLQPLIDQFEKEA